MNEERRIFDGIEVHGIRIDASGGLLDLSYKPYRRDRQYFIGMTPAIGAGGCRRNAASRRCG